MPLAEDVRRAGVIGAGGGGFPTHVKLAAKADTVIGNGAECEPLLHKDAAVMEHRAKAVVAGLELAMDAVGARKGVLGVKGKKKLAVAAIEEACRGTRVRVQLLGDYYPAGDEFDLVHEVTGLLIPPQGIPPQVGVVVCNVETLANIADASEGRPVTHKYVTIAGAVGTPATLQVPLGTSYREAIAAAGGLATDEPMLAIGGLMMGRITDDLDTPITKTDAGAIVLPRSHRVMERKLKTPEAQAHIGRSACDQCRYCTEFCPRYLLGYVVEPHQVMRSLSFTVTGEERFNEFAALCCACGLCTLYACPEDLYPKEACDTSKDALRTRGFRWPGPAPQKAHPMHDGRRVPISSLVRKLAVEAYDRPAPMAPFSPGAGRLVLPLKQGAGIANQPLVRAGERVSAGQALGEVPPGQLGAIVHSPSHATVESVTDQVVLARKP